MIRVTPLALSLAVLVLCMGPAFAEDHASPIPVRNCSTQILFVPGPGANTPTVSHASEVRLNKQRPRTAIHFWADYLRFKSGVGNRGLLYDPYPPDGVLIAKAAITIAAGAEITLRVPHKNREREALDYTFPHFPTPRVLADGQTRIVLTACPDHDTSWSGGILLTKPGCVVIDVTLGHKTDQIRFPAGVLTC